MPKRSSTKKAKRDFSQIAFDIVAKATSKGELAKPSDVSAVLDNNSLRKQIMREMGSRGGKKGGAARAANLTKEQRSEIAKKAAAKRWSE